MDTVRAEKIEAVFRGGDAFTKRRYGPVQRSTEEARE
jgi:hypothetical protein